MNNNRLVACVGLMLLATVILVLNSPQLMSGRRDMLVCAIVGFSLLVGGIANEMMGGG